MLMLMSLPGDPCCDSGRRVVLPLRLNYKKDYFMREIIVNPKLLETPNEHLLNELNQVSAFRDNLCLRFLKASLKCAQKWEIHALSNKTPPYLALKKNSSKTILILLKDSYQGKLNDYLREMLCNIELDLVVNKNMPNEPESAYLLKLKIKLAAALISKYVDLVSILMEGQLTKEEKMIVRNTIKYLKPITEHLHAVDLLYLIARFKLECTFQILHYSTQRCYSLFNFDNTVKKLYAVDLIINELMRSDLSTDEMTGALLLLYKQIAVCFKYDATARGLLDLLDKLFESDHCLSLNTHSKSHLIQVYIEKAKYLELEWPKPFKIENVNALEKISDYPQWSPGI